MKTKFLLLLISTFLFIGCGNNKQVDPALAGTITDPPAVEVADVRHDVWESISKTDCIKVNKGNVKSDHSHDDFSPAVDSALCPGETWSDVSGGAQNWLVLDVFNGDTYVVTTTVHWSMPVAPWTPYKDPISMDSDGKPDGILTFTTNGSAYNVAVTKE